MFDHVKWTILGVLTVTGHLGGQCDQYDPSVNDIPLVSIVKIYRWTNNLLQWTTKQVMYESNLTVSENLLIKICGEIFNIFNFSKNNLSSQKLSRN